MYMYNVLKKSYLAFLNCYHFFSAGTTVLLTRFVTYPSLVGIVCVQPTVLWNRMSVWHTQSGTRVHHVNFSVASDSLSLYTKMSFFAIRKTRNTNKWLLLSAFELDRKPSHTILSFDPKVCQAKCKSTTCVALFWAET